jgi:IS5 family transposase
MLEKLPTDDPRELFRTCLADLINPQHELALLSDAIDWNYFENEFKSLYSDKPSRRAMPIRLMVGVLMLKHLYNISDEKIPEHLVRDVYFQYFCGYRFFEHKFPCNPSNFAHFRKRIGEEGFNKIFAYSVKYSVKFHSAKVPAKFVLSDMTVQGNNTVFYTYAKICKKVIDKCNQIAEKEEIMQRCKYKRESKQLLRYTYNGTDTKRVKKAQKRLQNIANALLRELDRKMTEEQKASYGEKMSIYKRTINQQKNGQE